VYQRGRDSRQRQASAQVGADAVRQRQARDHRPRRTSGRAVDRRQEEITEIAGAVPGGRFVDFGAVHLVTTSALDALKGGGVPADVRRLRPNLVLSLGREPVPGDQI
jgi:hypothetical protein